MPRLPRRLILTGVALLALAALLGALALEGDLARETSRARGALQGALGRPPAGTAEAFARARAALRDSGPLAAAERLATFAAETPDAALHEAALVAAQAAGRFDLAAREAELRRRLLPGDAAAARLADAALDRALRARLRDPARGVALVAATTLLGLALSDWRRRVARRRRAAWVGNLFGRLQVAADGAGAAAGATIRGDAPSLALDLFLSPRAAPHAAPPDGATVSLVLSHAATNLTLRLPPRRGVRENAVRFRLSEASLGRVLGAGGLWRAQAAVDGRTIAESTLEVSRIQAAARPAVADRRRGLASATGSS